MSQSNLPTIPATIGELANTAAASAAFHLYKQEKAQRTLDNQRDSLALFERYLYEKGLEAVGLADGSQWWAQITHGLVMGFRQWMLNIGYSIGSVNVRLGHVRRYAALAHLAQLISADESNAIKLIQGIAGKSRHNVDEKRETTRVGTKKAEFNVIDIGLIEQLLDTRPPTPRGRRDALIVALGAYIGLRAGEMILLKTDDVNLAENLIHIWRPKIKKHHFYSMEPRFRACVIAVMGDYPSGLLLHALRRSGHGFAYDNLSDVSMSRVGVFDAIQPMGVEIGVSNLSPHDLRHTGATIVSRQYDMLTLVDWGGWSNTNTALGYIDRNKVMNEGIQISKEKQHD